ncbi:AvrE-family type 3 secretion system effector [Pseudomonas sp. NPDC086278]|uniref:AvrE-family type 3 secretion system effector n=1 Tax=Pseudomonas sp. NPDC086278 TaxID=3390646 RepID=UPI003D01F4E6
METISSTQTSAPLALSTDGMQGSSGSNPLGLQQTDAQPTQRSSHSLINFFKNKFGRSSDRNLVQVNAQPSQRMQAPTGAGDGNRNAVNPQNAAPAAPRQPVAPGAQLNDQANQIQRQVAVNDTPARVQLGAGGAADFQEFKPAVVGTVLKDALGRPGQTYQHAFSANNRQDHVLLEQQGHVLHVKQTPAALISLRSSQPEGAANQNGQQVAMLQQADATSVNVTHNGQQRLAPDGQALPPLETIGRAHEGHLTGIHQERDGVALRLHQNELYASERPGDAWKPLASGDLKFTQIAAQGNGKLFGQSGDNLIDLSSHDTPTVNVPQLKAFAVNPSNHAVTLSGDHSQTLQLFDFNQPQPASAVNKTLELNGGQAEPKSIGFSHERLFVSDTEGRLYSASYADMTSNAAVLPLMPEQNFQPDGERLGGDKQVTGFLSGNNGNVHALIRDSNGQTHSHALNEPAQRLGGGWNLSDVSVVVNNRDLPPDTSVSQFNTVDLGHLGKIGIAGGQVKRWDATTEEWKDTGIKDVSHLLRGLDGKAYVVHEGTVKKLDVKPVHAQFAVDGNHALKQAPSSNEVSIGEKLPGLDNRVVKAAAMLNEKEFVTLDDKGTLTAHHKKGAPTEVNKLNFEVGYLAIGADGTLYAKSAAGDLHMMHPNNWRADQDEARPDAPWTKANTPDDRKLESIRTGNDNTLTAKLEGGPPDEPLINVKDGHWKQLPASNPTDQKKTPDLFDRLGNAEHAKRIPGTGLTGRVTTEWMGRGASGGNVMSTNREFVKAHIFDPHGKIPRPVQYGADNIQHRYQGRDGLAPVYKQEGELLKKLDDLAKKPPAAPGQDMQSVIGRLDRLGPEGAELKNQLETFRGELEDSSYRATRYLGEQHGKSRLLHQNEGVLNKQGEVSAPSHRRDMQSKLHHAADKINPKSTGSDMLQDTLHAVNHVAPSAANPTAHLIVKMHDNGMRISHQKEQVPFGQRRDRGDDQALIKSRVALDLVTLDKLGPLLERTKDLRPGDQEGIKNLLKDQRLLAKEYDNNPIKVVTDAGETNHVGLEAHYDAIKSFTKGFSNENSATYTSFRAATGSKTKVETEENFKNELNRLEPGESLTMQRGYGANLSAPFVGILSKAVGPFPSASVGASRNYSLSASRAEDGITITLQRDGIGSATGGVGASKDFLPGMVGHENYGLGIGQRTLTPQVRFGADVTASASATQREAMTFTVPNEEIGQFSHDLFNGKMNPMELMKKVQDSSTQQGRLVNVDVNAGINAEVRGGMDLTSAGANPSSSTRAGLAAGASVNLLNYNSQATEKHTYKGDTLENSHNRPRAFTSASASASLKATLAGGHKSEHTQQGIGISLGGGVTAKVDNKTTKVGNVTYKQAEPLTADNLSKLSKSLGAAFKDPASQRELARLADRTQPEYVGASPKDALNTHLQGLEHHFSNKAPDSEERYAALRELRNSTVQQAAAEQNRSLVVSAGFATNYTDLSRLNHQGVASKLLSLASPYHSPSNAEHVADLLLRAPNLKTAIERMQATNGTEGKVELELKDDVKDRINAGIHDGTLTQKGIDSLTADRSNMRIKSITVSRNVGKQESFTSPLPLVSYSSAASVSETKTLGKIEFSYGRDQNNPKGSTISGEIGKPTTNQKATMAGLKNEGMQFKS